MTETASTGTPGIPDGQAAVDALANPPGQPALRRQSAPHALALQRLRDRLGAPGHDLALRSLARADADEPAIALLDAWAVVADTVSFYSERIANEAFLRTAVQLGSVRELARTLGYELRPGVAAQADLAVTAETAAGSPEVVTVAAGTPVQSVPGPGQLPQTFQTASDLEVRPVWNRLAALDGKTQVVAATAVSVWVRSPVTLRPGNAVLVISTEQVIILTHPVAPSRDLRTVTAVTPDAEGATGWTRLDLDHSLGPDDDLTPLPRSSLQVHAFRDRLRLFGWSAPDPNLLVKNSEPPPGASLSSAVAVPPPAEGGGGTPTYVWTNYGVTNPLDVDGDHPSILAGSWVALAQPGKSEAFPVNSVEPGGESDFAVSGPVTLVDVTGAVTEFERRQVVVLATSSALVADQEPDLDALSGTEVRLAACDPALPAGRRLLLSGTDAGTGLAMTAPVEVASCTVDEDGTGMTVTVADPLPPMRKQGLAALGNVVTVTHGEAVTQVLGSGDGRVPFPVYQLRRAPLTYLRAATPEGARAELVVRVDGVQWQEVTSLLDAGPQDRVYVVRHDEGGAIRVVFGDGAHGARPSTGVENLTAQYRVGIGEAGAVGARSLSILAQRPLGVREVTNPLAAQDWAPEETIEEARTNAPLRIRTLDRAVSVADHEDLARGYAGVGPVRADLLWDGQEQRVLLTLLGAQASPPSPDLVADLHAALDLAREPSSLLDVLAGQLTWFGLRVEVAHDPAYERQPVLDSVAAALQAAFGGAVRPFAAPVTSAAVLVVVRTVPGVTACTVPRLFPLAVLPEPPLTPTLPGDESGVELVTALPGRFEDGAVLPAQLLALAGGGVQIGVMTG